MRSARQRQQGGFSAVELTIAMVLLLVLVAITILSTRGAVASMRVNSALTHLSAELRTAREMAVSQRRDIQLTFTAPDQIQLTRLDQPSGTTVFPAVKLGDAGSQVEFTLFAGLPDTPDGFGNASAVSFGGSPTMIFRSDGSFVDSNNVPLNGSAFIGIPGHPATARAVTVLGTTGRVHRYRWTGSQWIN